MNQFFSWVSPFDSIGNIRFLSVQMLWKPTFRSPIKFHCLNCRCAWDRWWYLFHSLLTSDGLSADRQTKQKPHLDALLLEKGKVVLLCLSKGVSCFSSRHSVPSSFFWLRNWNFWNSMLILGNQSNNGFLYHLEQPTILFFNSTAFFGRKTFKQNVFAKKYCSLLYKES